MPLKDGMTMLMFSSDFTTTPEFTGSIPTRLEVTSPRTARGNLVGVIDALVIGASGMVGGQLLQIGQQRGLSVAGTYLSFAMPDLHFLDASDDAAVQNLVSLLKPHVIFLPAAFTNVDACERDPSLSQRINVTAMENVARACQRTGAKLVSFSSDYVFDGLNGPYDEDAAPNPVNVYGQHKLEAEQIAAAVGALVLRTNGVYGPEIQGKNFVLRLVQGLRAGQTWRIPVDQFGNPTLASDLALAAWDAIELSGIYHAAGHHFCDRYSFALEIARIFKLNAAQLEAVDTPSLGQAALRPLRGGLVSLRLEHALGWGFHGLEGLGTLLE